MNQGDNLQSLPVVLGSGRAHAVQAPAGVPSPRDQPAEAQAYPLEGALGAKQK